MSVYKTIVNPHTGQLQLTFDGTIVRIGSGVDTYNNLPVTGNAKGDARITSDTGHMYIWVSDSSSGSLSDWDDQGDIIDINWDSISGKPTSSVANIDDAVSKKHTQGTDQKLDEGGANEVDVADVKNAVDRRHTQNTDTKLDEGGNNEVNASEIVTAIKNIAVLGFNLAIETSKSIFNLANGIIDEYEDESGIDTVASSNEYYDSSLDSYEPLKVEETDIKLILNLNGINGATTTIDESPSAHVVTFNGNTNLTTSVKKWGTASLNAPGSDGDFLSIPDSTDWDICENLVDDWTIHLQINPTWNGTDTIIAHWEDANNQWRLARDNAGGLYFLIRTGGSTVFITDFGGSVSTGSFHHIAVVKKGNVYAIYIDGIQVTYNTTSATDTFTGQLQIAGMNQANHCVNAYLDAVTIIKTNLFNASPNVGLTDTITVPTSEYNPSVTINDMTLISETFLANSEADLARLVILLEEINSITLNTDLLAYASRDDGTTWSQVILSDDGDFAGSKKILTGNVDISGQPSGTNMRYKIETLNEKDCRIHGTSQLWD